MRMNAKTYLSQVRLLEIKIRQKKQECESLKELAMSTGGLDYSKDRVQTGFVSNESLSKSVIKYTELEHEIELDINAFIELRHARINEIHQLEDARDVEILYKRYIEYKSLELIAVEMSFSYEHVRHLHGRALQHFASRMTQLNTQ